MFGRPELSGAKLICSTCISPLGPPYSSEALKINIRAFSLHKINDKNRNVLSWLLSRKFIKILPKCIPYLTTVYEAKVKSDVLSKNRYFLNGTKKFDYIDLQD
ncbi:hypothetical protein ACTXT7_005645 [Hymenolepis weldensis]